MTRPRHEFELVRFYIDWGLNNCEIERLTGIPRNTVRGWRSRAAVRLTNSSKQDALGGRAPCPICEGATFDHQRYAYLLGMYLGDGCLSRHHRGVYKLRIVLDQRYPNIIGECAEAIEGVSGKLRVGFVQREGCIEVNSYWKHWPCLFPQHGAGRKHDRAIRLEAWQAGIADEHTGRLLRGLIHSDGCRGTNRVRRPVDGRMKEYSYLRYQFSNESSDIKRIFCDACDRLGIPWRRMNRKTISVARADGVEALDVLIGPKS
jgi:hypothetical protein